MDQRSLDALEQENAELRRRLDEACRFDPLTGLLSKGFFYEAVSELLRQAPSTSFSIVCFDICRFKLVNDLEGMEQGDRLLCAFADALQAQYPSQGDTFVARLGGDLFAVCVPSRSKDLVERELAAVCAACPPSFNVFAVAGVYRIKDRGLSVGLMCDRAMMALHAVKGSYFGRISEYEPGLRDALVTERMVQDGIEAALDADQIEPFFQPKCDIRTGKIVGAEALVRWRHPERGLVSPAEFVPILERSGFIRALDVRVWEKTVAWMADLAASGIEPVPVSVNVSRADIDGMDVCAVLGEIVARYGIDPALLEVEITESAYVDQHNNIVEASDRLMNSGFTVLMDDFGSGYSSLNMLKDISVNVLKIDMRFLDRTDRRSRDIMESVVHMAHWLGLPVIAEGVETDDQVEFLLDVGCVFAQGYLFYRPMDADSFVAILADGSNVDRRGMGRRLAEGSSTVFDFKDLLHEDVLSDRMLSNILGAVVLYSLEGDTLRVVRCNPAYRHLVGWEMREDQVQEVLDSIHPEDRAVLLDAAKLARQAQDDEGAEAIVRRLNRDGVQWLELHLFHLYASGEADVLYASVADVTRRMEDLEALRMSEHRFELAMKATGLVVFELDVESRTARYSEYTQKAFGLDAPVSNAPEGIIGQGTVDDVSVDDFRAMYEAIYRGEDRASSVVRVHMADGSLAWSRITLMAVKGHAGKASKAVGMVENVTREKEMELTLGLQAGSAHRD
ncbi:MAG: EAL domain-containing protein [Gordonibacter sp.]|uniref:EAL domain-containing protein n=1 Tax=Gordonibacter sp. TaxID=1968902 RepID=UPI002FC75FCF